MFFRGIFTALSAKVKGGNGDVRIFFLANKSSSTFVYSVVAQASVAKTWKSMDSI